MDHGLQLDGRAEDFLNYIGPLLYQDEAVNSLMLGVATRLADGSIPAHFIRVVRHGRTVAGAMKAGHPNLVLSTADPSSIEFLARQLPALDIAFPSVVGPQKEAEIFAAEWGQVTHRNSRLLMSSRIFQVDRVVLPNVAGHLRPADQSEVDLITQWLVEFGEEALAPQERKDFAGFRPHAQTVINKQSVYVWTVDKRPVAMSQISRPTKNGISISGVYTPTPFRKNGYGSAVVAHLSQKMLQAGRKFCVLYTDLSNPTSNKIYQQIGYYAVGDSKNFSFD